MEGLAAVLFYGLFGIVSAISAYRAGRRRKVARGLAAVAEELGLTVGDAPFMRTAPVRGKLMGGRLLTTVESVPSTVRAVTYDAHVDVLPGGGLPTSFRIQPLNFLEELGTRRALFQTGDPAFDACVSVVGPPAYALAVLTSRVRGDLVALMGAGHVTIDEHGGRALVAGALRGVTWADAAVDATRTLARVVDSVTVPEEEVPARLARRSREDHLSEVRAACAAELMRSFPSMDEARAVALDHVDGDRADLALLAAVVLVEDDVDRVAAGVLDEALDDALRADAVRVLERTLGDGAEEPLARCLAAKAPVVLTAVLEGLGRVGSIDVIARMRAAAERPHSGWGLGNTVDAAVLAIQGRATDRDAGRLALSDAPDTQGALSTLPDAGALTEVE